MHPLPLLCLCPVHPQGHAQSNERSLQTSHKQTQDNARYSELSAILPSRLQTEILKPWVSVMKLIPPVISSLSDLALEWKQRQPSTYKRLSTPLSSKFSTATEVVLKEITARVDNILFLILNIMNKKWFMSVHVCFLCICLGMHIHMCLIMYMCINKWQGSCSMVNISSSWYDDHKVWYHDILSDSKSLNYLTETATG